jgi:single-strand selective monofunctional uracil DNA glycosylase
MATPDSLIVAARRLRDAVAELRFAAPVAYVYDPLVYAWHAHEIYLRRYGNGHKRVLFLGMNPGPFGMAQTGIPFGEIAAVRDWLGIQATIERPPDEHPKRPVMGFNCTRSEISGQRLWALFAKRFGSAEKFFEKHLVVNYCPLAFVEASGRNRTPDKLPSVERTAVRHRTHRASARFCIRVQPALLPTTTGAAPPRSNCENWAFGNKLLISARLEIYETGN